MGNFGVFPLSAPSGGINLVDAIDNMPPQDAIELVNLYSDGQKVITRGGYSLFADTANPSFVSSLYSLPLADGSEKLFAALDNKFYVLNPIVVNITGSTTPTSSEWNGSIYRHHFWLCNGQDTVQVYNGTTINDATYTGVTLSTLINQSTYQDRNYFVEKNSASFWYSGQNAITGALTEYPLDSFFHRGGFLLFCGSYTASLGDVETDFFLACSSEGELLFYQGLSPSDTATPWKLRARFVIGRPLGYRAFVRVDSDLWIITSQGIVPVSMLFSGGSTVAANSVSRKINKIIQEAAREFPFSHLWTGRFWHQGKRVYIPIPLSVSDTYFLVCNTETGAWSKYELSHVGRGISIEIYDDTPYLGAVDGIIYEFERTSLDSTLPVPFEMRLAFSFFNTRQQAKFFKEIRPLVFAVPGTTLNIGMDTDFRLTDTTREATFASAVSTPWGSPWGSAWSSEATYLFDRFGLEGKGHSGSLHITGEASERIEFSVFEIRFEAGAQV